MKQKGLFYEINRLEELTKLGDPLIILAENNSNVQRSLFSKDVILQGVYFKFRFSLSYRDIEELLSIRGLKIDNATIQPWVY